MNLFSRTTYRNWFILGLAVQVIAAWFSVGYYHPDEHFQILEFYNYKQGYSPLSDLPWEFSAHCRPALQPFIVHCTAALLKGIGIVSPFILAFVLRLMMGVLTWWTTARLVTLLLPQFSDERGKKIFVIASFLLWFVPYIGVRFSSETIAANFFFLAISILLQVGNMATGKRVFQLMLAGLLLGFSLFLRLQMGFAFIGLAIWLLFINKMNWKYLIILCLAGSAAIGLSVGVDHWFYGVWVFTPYNYFNVNIIQHVAAKFGVDPWWHYFVLFFNRGVAPVSLLMIVLFFKGILKKPFDLFSLICITFFLGHFLIGHKELRFLFPASFAFIFVCCSGLNYMLEHYKTRKVYRVVFRLLVVINMAVLVFKLFTPAEEVMKYYGFIYSYAQKQPTTIVSFDKSPYKMDVIESNFYKPQNLKIEVLHQPAELAEIVKQGGAQAIIYLSNNLNPGPELADYRVERIYCQFPDWVLAANFNHWQERSYIWAVFRIYPKS